MTNKNDLRKIMRERKRQFTGEKLGEMSLSAVTGLLSHYIIKNVRTIFIYYSLPDEVDTHALADVLADSGKTVLLPAVTGDCDMELHRYEGKQSLKRGAYGIMEPTGELYTCYENIDVAVVPGMAFDAENNRLGRGKGYYDRFLAKMPGTYKIGLCFDFQKVEKLPADKNDIKMDEVICNGQ
ncbi:5-formyltetrahydrofolate cyclo-ligase [Prevotella sp. PCHR]|uniref:5-formyltetrahydrofolate cyclo-ligase n=1 Tax=Xylanibacter caecicola TaxID=2736294 RepID=A0ABX2AYH9_9BACT|nr:5-formyltetrahydrofolate cyclo-ligase [Xylanibacter caecicola]NPE24301.1 5-formyltetrahydrofolate cyclo-ligase [Xylanibacter caecicola]